MEWTVSGPGTEGRGAPNEGSALILAQGLASKRDARPGTWYVRRPDGAMRFHVTREEDTSVTTRAVRDEAPAADYKARRAMPVMELA